MDKLDLILTAPEAIKINMVTKDDIHSQMAPIDDTYSFALTDHVNEERFRETKRNNSRKHATQCGD